MFWKLQLCAEKPLQIRHPWNVRETLIVVVVIDHPEQKEEGGRGWEGGWEGGREMVGWKEEGNEEVRERERDKKGKERGKED